VKDKREPQQVSKSLVCFRHASPLVASKSLAACAKPSW